MNDLPKRLLTAILLGVIVISGIWYSAISFAIVLLIIGYFSSLEYICLASNRAIISSLNSIQRLGAILAILPLGVYVFFTTIFVSNSLFLSATIGLVGATFLWTYFLWKNEIDDGRLYQSYAMAVVYIGLPLLIFYWVSTRNGDYVWLKPMSLLILIWTNDSMAYFTGRFFGKRPLYATISPKKTMEGFVGGLLFTMIIAWIISNYIPSLNQLLWILYGILVSTIGTVGDLFESMIKRRYGVKDSGNSLPGHGGFLDRFDAFLFLLPTASLFIYLFWK